MSLEHPRLLYTISVAELFERTAGVFLSTLLILYLTERHGFSVARATRHAGTFHALTYLTPLLGGLIADRLLGYRAALLLGSALLMAGNSVLALGPPSLVYLALGLLILGQGFFRPSILTAVGRIYDGVGSRRDAGFNFFYVAVNIGSALGPFLGSAIKNAFGWPRAFVFATAAMTMCFLTLALSWRRLPLSKNSPQKSERVVSSSSLAELRPVVLLLLVLAIYLVAYVQGISTVLLFARDRAQRLVYGHEVPVGAIAAVPAVLVVILASPIARLMDRLQPRFGEQRTTMKMVVGLLVSTFAFVVLAGAAWLHEDEKVPLVWLGLSLVLLTVGEILIIPMGQSLLGTLAPASLTALTIGLWYGAMAVGFWLGGFVGAIYERWTPTAFFGLCAGVLSVAALGMGWLRLGMRQKSGGE